MIMLRRGALLLLLALLGCSKKAPPPAAVPPSPIATKPPTTSLDEADAAHLDKLFQIGLFDPVEARATRIRGTMSVPDCFGKMVVRKASGWLVTPQDDQPRRVVLDNLQETEPPDAAEPCDFVAEAPTLSASNREPEYPLTFGGFGGHASDEKNCGPDD